jgi:hypothetical protein
MIAEEPINISEPDLSTQKGTTILFILKIIKKTPFYFNKALINPKLSKPLNENKLTQIFVEQINAILHEYEVPISALTQFNDLIYNTKGIPDFYFYKMEIGNTNEPLFVLESKRLPSLTFETEYVKGKTNNGGIERFKLEKHGKGLSECGMIGFIEDENCAYWKTKINSWIIDLANSGGFWNNGEILIELENQIDYSYLNSVADTISSKRITLHHFWIEINNP